MSTTTSRTNNSVYYLDDLECQYCLYAMHITKRHKNPCCDNSCRYETLLRDATENGRIKREEGAKHNESDKSKRREEQSHER
jgi:hypothetical protein